MADNPALYAAAQKGPVTAVFVVTRGQWSSHDVGAPRLAFLARTLRELQRDLARLGIVLHFLQADEFAGVPQVLAEFARQQNIARCYFNAEYGWNERLRDKAVVDILLAAGVDVRRSHGGVTLAPGEVRTLKGEPFKVFTPFKRAWLQRVQPQMLEPLPVPAAQAAPLKGEFELPGFEDIDEGLFKTLWPAGEAVAHQRLEAFVRDALADYSEQRDIPALPGTSGLSAYLSVGSISATQCLAAAYQRRATVADPNGVDTWVSELIWREFYRHVLQLFPHVSRDRSFRREMDRLPWRHDPEALAAWQAGRTGYPLVDAAMRQLVATGWMHNRLRMVVAMFLTKHLLLDWRHGERFFMQQLVDGDFASNNGGWQWSASTGTDAAPYFRVFNPASQGQKFDPRGEFTRQYLPELADVPDKFLYEPHLYSQDLDYPAPIVDYKEARQRAIDTFKSLG